MNLILDSLPDVQKVIVTHSGGLDSSTAVIACVEKYGAENVISVGYNYGQKQSIELDRAQALCDSLGVTRRLLDLGILGDIVRPVSANITGTDVNMPTIKEVLGDPQPVTEVPFRNMILFSMTAALAQVEEAGAIICGLQVHDQYSYWDTTQQFIDSINDIFSINRQHKIVLSAPFAALSKAEEIQLLISLGGKHTLLEHTLTCYNPDQEGRSCAKCPSCAERIKAYMDLGLKDPIQYQMEIPW